MRPPPLGRTRRVKTRDPSDVPAARWRALVLATAVAALALGCAASMSDLLADLEYGDPEAVREAVLRVRDHLRAKEQAREDFDAADREAIDYLKDLARRSPDPAVRATAIASLAALRSHDATDVYLEAAGDDAAAWIVRLEAARALSLRPNAAAAGPLARRLGAEPQTEVRLAVISALRAVGGDVALQALLDAFLDRSLRFEGVRLALYEAVRELSGNAHSFWDREAWSRYRAERFPPKM